MPRRVALTPHPKTPPHAVRAVEVEVHDPSAGQVRLRFAASGDNPRLVLPAPAAPERADNLWRTTCFETFVRTGQGDGYDEFNFSPSTQWAVYRFDDYRSGGRNVEVLPPRIEGGSIEDGYALHAAFDLPGSAPWRLGLAAVIEEAEGVTSYWALAHPSAKPDFHHRDAFLFVLNG